MAARSPLPPLDAGLVAALVEGRHARPHDWLGQHPLGDGWVIRAVRPLADAVVAVRADGSEVALEHVDAGLWQGYAPGPGQAYRLRARYAEAPDWLADDPYRFVPSIGEVDLFL